MWNPSSKLLLPLQAGVAVLALAMGTMWPPSSGAMLMVSLVDRDANALARMALTGGALLVGPGPFPGSMIVRGDRSAIDRQIDRHAIVIIAAPAAGCGGATGSGV